MAGAAIDRPDMYELEVQVDESETYRLLQLTPQLEKSLREGSLTLRGGGTNVNVCTAESTHVLRRLKQSNTLLFATPQQDALRVFASPSELLESIEVPPTADWSLYPLYTGRRSIKANLERVEPTCSLKEYAALCKDKPAVDIGSATYVISPQVVHRVLVDLVSGMVEKGDIELTSDFRSIDLQVDEAPEVIDAVYNKFRAEGGLDIKAISTWIGEFLLQSRPGGMTLAALKKEWSADLPVKLTTDIGLLEGRAVETKPGWVQFVDAQSLPYQAQPRIDRLFALKPEWELSEIAPFLNPLLPAGQKMENWILKHARKRRIGSQIVVSRRNR